LHKLSDYHYHLPPQRIAQHPVEPRDHSRLMVVQRAGRGVSHFHFKDLPTLLKPGDLLVTNNTRVLPARIVGRKASGGKIEALALSAAHACSGGNQGTVRLECLVKASKAPRPDTLLIFDKGIEAQVVTGSDGRYTLAFNYPGDSLSLLEQIGQVPLPPYIRRDNGHGKSADRDTYQTVYATKNGAIAAPTAGLHFTPQLLARLSQVGIETVAITLHVGYATFEPVRVEMIDQHRMHAESVTITHSAADHINAAKAQGRRIVAVGTTSVRALEWAADGHSQLQARQGECELFIYPGYTFKMVDAMITNFHLPQSTLLMLVSAFADRQRILTVYRQAVAEGYRFYSYGDAMLIE
jgi:S-adenosylmethionine:tRNA ribosyltransferase-isomerase